MNKIQEEFEKDFKHPPVWDENTKSYISDYIHKRYLYFIKGYKSRDAEIGELKGCNAVLGDSVNFQQTEIKKLREALERIRPWISRITDGILSDWQEELCWDIDLICEEALKDGK